MDSRRSRNCENLLTVKSKMADVRLTELQFFNRRNSAEDCSTSLEFGTEFDYMTDAILQTYKVKLWKVKVTAWRTEIHHPSYFPDLAPSDYHMLSIQRSISLETDFHQWCSSEIDSQHLFFILQVSKIYKIVIECALTKAVITLKNKCMLIRLSFV